VAGTAGCVFALAACSGGPADAGASSAAPAAPSAAATGSVAPTLATLPAERCLTGTWALVRFVGTDQQTYGTGEGGDVTVRFADGRYTLAGAGKKPVTVTLAGQAAGLTVDGRAPGTFAVKGDRATFAQKSASGTGTIEVAGHRQRLTMDQVTSVVGLTGDGQVACTPQAMTITLTSVRLELARA
jgi:hypothetical protein